MLRILELYYNFFDRFFNVNRFEEFEMDTDSCYLDLAHENFFNFVLTA